jgi:sortase (surface protein transpeptidase)
MTERGTNRMLSRRGVMTLMIGAASSLAVGSRVVAAPVGVPTTTGGAGTLKAGPLGLNQTPSTGELPVQMLIPDAEVDAEVEVRTAVDGAMQDPTGPWVISWYDFTVQAGAMGNSVYSGHVDYWEVGPAVLRNVANLGEGAEIEVVGQNGGRYTYAIEYIERVTVADLTPEDFQNIVGDTDYAALTIITCGGEFDYDAGEYKQRDIVRARLSASAPGTGGGETTEPAAETDATQETTESGGEEGGGELAAGGTATITDDGVNVRSDASTSGDIVTSLAAGETVTITGESQEADGYTWWPIQTADFLQP